MNKKKTDIFITIPHNLIRDTDCLEIRPGICMAFCWLYRYGFRDGLFRGTLNDALNILNLTYYPEKKKEYPQQLKRFISGLDYLCNNGFCTLLSGDYNYFNNCFEIKLDLNVITHTRYISLDFADFDYIIQIKEKHNKCNLLFTLLWVKTNFVKHTVNNIDNYETACSYKHEVMAKLMGFKEVSLYQYLARLSVNEGLEGDQPLLKSKPYSIKINENKMIRLPSIYVENFENAQTIIFLKKKQVIDNFHKKSKNDSFEYQDVLTDEEWELFS